MGAAHAVQDMEFGHGNRQRAQSYVQPLHPGRDSLPAGSHAVAMRTPSSSSEDQPWILLLSKAHVPDVPLGAQSCQSTVQRAVRGKPDSCFPSLAFAFPPAKQLIMACEGLAHTLSIDNVDSL